MVPPTRRPCAQARAADADLAQRVKLSVWLIAATLVAAILSLASVARAAPAPDSFADLAERLLPAVVNVSTSQRMTTAQRGGSPELPQFPPGSPFEEFFKDFFDRREDERGQPGRQATSLGSGFIVDPSGYVVTNNHVIEGADEITIILQDDTNLIAELVGVDEKTDIAVLKVEPTRPLPSVRFGDSDDMRVGDWVIAIGNPFGLGGTVTAGIISAQQRNINSGPYDDFIQTDASINRGNSGGPMFDLQGDVIGINTAIYSPSGGSVGIGFAIPSKLAENVVNQIIEFGRTRRGWLGVRIQSVTEEIAENLGLQDTQGALVASVNEGGPAADGGVEPGDVILRFNNRPVTEMRRLPRLVAETPVNQRVAVQVWRKGRMETLRVTLGELEAAEEAGLLAGLTEPGEPVPESQDLDELGLSLSGLNDDLLRQYGITPGTEGVVVTEVVPGSPAEEKGLRPGEVIIEIGQEKVTSAADVARMVEEAREAGRRSVLLLIDRDGDLRFVALSVTG
ncbi:MAG: DegQ family serine endoprotease [Inquilinus sp.]|nr:DegQ family serine endoprotease [Inquilinus sp.]